MIAIRRTCLGALACLGLHAAEPPCSGARWQELKQELEAATKLELPSPRLIELTSSGHLDWFRGNYQDCVEGLLSVLLFLASEVQEHRQALLQVAEQTARELSPLALRSGLSTWPFFGLLGELHLVWQGGTRAATLDAVPRLAGPCSAPVPGHIFSLLGALNAGEGSTGSLHLARALRPGSLLVDAGVFDGTDWSLVGVLAGATVLGFEPLAKNRRLIETRFPAKLAEDMAERGNHTEPGQGPLGKGFTLVPLEPGQALPRSLWHSLELTTSGMPHGGRGHSYIFGAALGEAVREVKMITRYDYSSVVEQGHMLANYDQDIESIAMTTLDVVLYDYLQPSQESGIWIDVLKLDVEGYELGALKGAERLLAEGRVKYLVVEFHPGMMGSAGTDPEDLLRFLQHYCFICHSYKIPRSMRFDKFVQRYTSNPEMLPVQGLGALEDLVCEQVM